MNNAILLRVHRWITLVFALPLIVVVVTGLILSFQPVVQTASVKPGSLTSARLETLIKQYDPENKARSLSINGWDNMLSLSGVGPDGEIDVDLATGAETEQETPLSDLFSSSRRMHEHLIGDLGWLVTGSTIAMLVIIALGVLMGLPRLRNTVSGWHKGVAWFTLPLVIVSPLTGLFLAFGINLGNPQPARSTATPAAAAQPQAQAPAATPAPAQQRSRAPAMPMVDAVRLIAASKDPSTIVSIGVRGGRMMARLNEGGELRAYSLSRDGLAPLGRNWPRLIHEGNWMGYVSGAVNIVTSFAILGLLGTGLFIWARRSLRPRRRTRPVGATSASLAAEVK